MNPELNINVVTVALGDADESAFFKVMPDSSMGKLDKSPFQADAAAIGELPVMVRQIDSLLQSREIPPPNVVKIDVEGCEFNVLRGALDMLRTSRPKSSWKRTVSNSRKLVRNNFCNWVIRSVALNARFPAKIGRGISSVCHDEQSRKPSQPLAKEARRDPIWCAAILESSRV